MATVSALLWPLRAVPMIRTAGVFPLDERGFRYQYLAPFHALHIYDYSGAIRLGRKTYALRPGDVTLTPRGVAARYDLPAPGRHWVVHFFGVPARKAALRLPLHFALGPQREFAVQRLMAVARWHAQAQAASGATDMAGAAAGAVFQELLLWLAMLPHAPGASARHAHSEAALQKLVAVLDSRFTEDLSVPDLAEEVGLTQNYLAARFRRRFGMTIGRYLLMRRVAHARDLLLNTDLPVGRIAERVGLPDPQHFNKQFRKLTGASPSAIRRGG